MEPQFYWEAAESDQRADLEEAENEIHDACNRIVDLVPDDPTSPRERSRDLLSPILFPVEDSEDC
ncbi:hypothetical protein ACIBL3_20320 [Kribbella sp. NPDC050124]|uniref:hypothetical protein n=1 Tax=Kribbella sp. NPDC050124 TaxID=3364114 RepID=UPI003787E6F4